MEDGRGLLRLKPILARVWGESIRWLEYIGTGCGEKERGCVAYAADGRKHGGRAPAGTMSFAVAVPRTRRVRAWLAMAFELPTTFTHVVASPQVARVRLTAQQAIKSSCLMSQL
jgi:hypothetical protein